MFKAAARRGEEELPLSAGAAGVDVGGAGGVWVGDRSRFRHTVLEKGVHFFSSSSPALHLQDKTSGILEN